MNTAISESDEDDDYSSDDGSEDEASLSERMAAATYIITSDEAIALLDQSDDMKASANEQFKAGNYEAALLTYSDALKLLGFRSPTGSLGDRQCQQVILLSLNLAAAHLKLGQYDMVLHRCSNVLIVDPVNLKALYRSAQALLQLDRVAEAEDGIQQGLKLAPGDEAFLKLAQEAEAKKQRLLDREISLFKRMFR